MPLVRSNDAPDSADPVRCTILQTDARPLPFFPPNRVSSDGSRPRGRSMDAVGALDPDPAADTASRLPLAPILAVSTADAPLSPRVTRRSGAIFGLVPSTGAPPHDAHPGSPGGGFGGSPYGGGGSYGGDTRETQQYTDYQCVHARIPPTSPDASRRARCASNQISPTRTLRTIAPPTIRVVISPPRLFTTPHRNMGNGWVQRTRRSTVERVIERVHTDVDEMVPMRGGAGGHLHRGGGGGGSG